MSKAKDLLEMAVASTVDWDVKSAPVQTPGRRAINIVGAEVPNSIALNKKDVAYVHPTDKNKIMLHVVNKKLGKITNILLSREEVKTLSKL